MYLKMNFYGVSKALLPIDCTVVSNDFMNIRRKISSKKKLSIADVSNSLKISLSDKMEKG